LIAPHGEIVTVYHDIDKSRSLPWDRRPEDSRILRDLKDVRRGWAARIEATQREKSAAESVLATAPPRAGTTHARTGARDPQCAA
jgi:hypothetical protein